MKCASELEFFLFRESYEEAQAKRFQDLTPHSGFIEDYHILQTTRDEYLIRQIRNGMDARGRPGRVLEGRGRARASTRSTSRYADALTMADRHVIYKNGAKEIAGLNGRSLTFMAKYAMDDVGSSCHVHSSVWDADGDRVADVAGGRARPHVARRSAAGSAGSSRPGASSRGCSRRR